MGKVVVGYVSRPIDFDRLRADILDRLDIAAEYQAMGVRLAGSGPAANGWWECHAIDRPDADPSAGVCTVRGHAFLGCYKDQGEGGTLPMLPFFKFATKHGKHGDWYDTIKHFADRAGLKPEDYGTIKINNEKIFVCEYVYQDETGAAVFAATRWVGIKSGEKTFTQKCMIKGKWVPGGWRNHGVEPVPYRLPELIGADPAAVVYVVEGEKDALALARLGLVATTNAGGTAGGRTAWPGFPGRFRGRDVVLIPDNDRAGRDHMQAVAGWLHGSAARIRVLTLPGLAEKEDVSDWLARGGSKSELGRLTATAPDFDPGIPAPTGQNGATGPGGSLPAIGIVGGSGNPGGLILPGGADWARLAGEMNRRTYADIEKVKVNWLIPDRIPFGGIALLTGEQNQGKSWLAVDLAGRISAGGLIPGGGGECFRPAKVVIFSAEDNPGATIRPRLEAAGARLDWVEEVKTVLTDGKHLRRFNFAEHRDHIEALLNIDPWFRVFIIDPIVSYLGGGRDTNRDTDIREILDPLAELMLKYDALALCITHFNKALGSRAIHRVSGNAAFTQASRALWVAVPDPDDETETRHFLLGEKFSLGPKVGGFTYRIEATADGEGLLTWEDEYNELTMSKYEKKYGKGGKGEGSGSRGRPAKSRAETIEWLRAYLTEHGPTRGDEIVAAAAAVDYGKNLIWEVKKDAGIRNRKEGDQWVWYLPDEPGRTNDNGDRFP